MTRTCGRFVPVPLSQSGWITDHWRPGLDLRLEINEDGSVREQSASGRPGADETYLECGGESNKTSSAASGTWKICARSSKVGAEGRFAVPGRRRVPDLDARPEVMQRHVRVVELDADAEVTGCGP